MICPAEIVFWKNVPVTRHSGSGAVAESRRFIFIGAFNFLTQAAMN
jgi:hypothetical protein